MTGSIKKKGKHATNSVKKTLESIIHDTWKEYENGKNKLMYLIALHIYTLLHF